MPRYDAAVTLRTDIDTTNYRRGLAEIRAVTDRFVSGSMAQARNSAAAFDAAMNGLGRSLSGAAGELSGTASSAKDLSSALGGVIAKYGGMVIGVQTLREAAESVGQAVLQAGRPVVSIHALLGIFPNIEFVQSTPPRGGGGATAGIGWRLYSPFCIQRKEPA